MSEFSLSQQSLPAPRISSAPPDPENMSPWRLRTAFLVGAAGALERTQIHKVHLFVIVVLVWALIAHGPRFTKRTWAVIAPVAILASTAYFGPLVNTRATALQLVALAACGGIIASTSTAMDRLKMVSGFLTVTVVAAVLALGQVIHVVPSVLFHGEHRPDGLIYTEPDFLGAYAATALIMALWIPARAKVRAPVVMLLSLAVLFSGARASWAAVAGGVFLTAVVSAMHKRRIAGDVRPIRIIIALGIAVLAALVFSSSLRTSVMERYQAAIGGSVAVNSSTSQSVISAQARRNQNAGLRELARTAPWYGQGLTASGRVQAFGEIDYGSTSTGEATNNIGSNWVLAWWADGKFLALPTFLMFAVAIKRGLWTGAGVTLAALLINNLFTNTSLLPITWFVLGLSFLARFEQEAGKGDASRVGKPAHLPST